jgi:hypothetical protein
MESLSKIKRIACLWLPNWSIQRILVAKPELARTVLLLTKRHDMASSFFLVIVGLPGVVFPLECRWQRLYRWCMCVMQ